MVVVHPEYALLILEVNELKEEIADLIVERDTLVNYVCRDLEIDYLLKIGSLEYKLAVAENKYQKNLRKLELIEEKHGQNLPIHVTQIDKKVMNEFKKQDKIEKNMLADIDFAIEMTTLEMFDYDLIQEMNLDYFKLQKLYNPIFDIDVSTEKEKIYNKIEKYYQRGNLKKLHKLAESYEEDDIFQDEISNLKKLRDKYYNVLTEIRREVRKIKNSFPYNQRLILKDEILCRRKKDHLNRQIIQVNSENKKLEKKIQQKLN